MTPQKQAERETIAQTNEYPPVGMSLDDYLEALAETQHTFELLDGERLDKLPQVWRHSWLIRYLFRLLDAFVTQYQLGTIEVISASDRMSVLNKKVKTDKANGVRLIWLIDESNQEVTEHYDDSIRILGIGDTLDGKDILPNFGLSIQTLFAQ
jgi:Uma2 family endonuclease